MLNHIRDVSCKRVPHANVQPLKELGFGLTKVIVDLPRVTGAGNTDRIISGSITSFFSWCVTVVGIMSNFVGPIIGCTIIGITVSKCGIITGNLTRSIFVTSSNSYGDLLIRSTWSLTGAVNGSIIIAITFNIIFSKVFDYWFIGKANSFLVG